MAADLCEELGVADRCHLSRIQLGIPPLNFFVIWTERHVGESVQQESHEPLPIFFGKFFRLFLDFCKLNHDGRRVSPAQDPCNLEFGCHVHPKEWIGYSHPMNIEVEQEEDGRWIAAAPAIPGALAYGGTQTEAISKVEALVLRILADRLDQGETAPELDKVFTVAA